MRIATRTYWRLGLFGVVAFGCVHAKEPERDSDRVRVAGVAPEVAGSDRASTRALRSADPGDGREEQASTVADTESGVRSAGGLSLGEIAAYAQRWTAAVRADRNYGAAVILDRTGLLLTNQHVIDSARSIT